MLGDASEDENVDLTGTGASQRAGALLSGGSRCQDVIDEQDVAAAHGSSVGHRERPRQVAPPVLLVQTHLRHGCAVAS
jgi:hypothetical protein